MCRWKAEISEMPGSPHKWRPLEMSLHAMNCWWCRSQKSGWEMDVAWFFPVDFVWIFEWEPILQAHGKPIASLVESFYQAWQLGTWAGRLFMGVIPIGFLVWILRVMDPWIRCIQQQQQQQQSLWGWGSTPIFSGGWNITHHKSGMRPKFPIPNNLPSEENSGTMSSCMSNVCSNKKLILV